MAPWVNRGAPRPVCQELTIAHELMTGTDNIATNHLESDFSNARTMPQSRLQRAIQLFVDYNSVHGGAITLANAVAY